MKLEDFIELQVGDFYSIFRTKYWYIVYLDENNEELDFDGYERIILTNPFYESLITLSHDIHINKKSNFAKLSLTTGNMLHYTINQEYDYSNSTKKEAVTLFQIYCYRKESDPNIFPDKFLEYYKSNKKQFKSYIITNEFNQIVSSINYDILCEQTPFFIGPDRVNLLIQFDYSFRFNKADFFKLLKKGDI